MSAAPCACWCVCSCMTVSGRGLDLPASRRAARAFSRRRPWPVLPTGLQNTRQIVRPAVLPQLLHAICLQVVSQNARMCQTCTPASSMAEPTGFRIPASRARSALQKRRWGFGLYSLPLPILGEVLQVPLHGGLQVKVSRRILPQGRHARHRCHKWCIVGWISPLHKLVAICTKCRQASCAPPFSKGTCATKNHSLRPKARCCCCLSHLQTGVSSRLHVPEWLRRNMNSEET